MIYTQVILAGQQVMLPGGYNITILESSQNVDIDLLGPGGSKVESAKGVPASWYWRQPEWTQSPLIQQVVITALAFDTAIKISISSGNSGVNILSGIVKTIDGSKERVKAGDAFVVNVGVVPALGTQYAYVEVKNSSATRNIVINKFFAWHLNSVGAAGAGYVRVHRLTAQLSTPVAGVVFNKKINDLAVVGVDVYSQLSTSLLGADFTLMGPWLAEYERFNFEVSEPLILGPGERVAVTSANTGHQITLNLHGYMEDR